MTARHVQQPHGIISHESPRLTVDWSEQRNEIHVQAGGQNTMFITYEQARALYAVFVYLFGRPE